MKTSEFNALVERITKKVIERLSEIEQQQCTVFGANQDWLTPDELAKFRLTSKKKNEKLIIITEFSFENLVNICHFDPRNDMEKTIVQAIKNGQKFMIIKEGRTYLPLFSTGKYALKQKVLAFESELYRYGGNFVSLKESNQKFSTKKNISPYENKQNRKYLTAKELITKNIQPETTLLLSEQVRLTDQAKEYIREKKININLINEK
jgi:ethanolamine utilization protein